MKTINDDGYELDERIDMKPSAVFPARIKMQVSDRGELRALWMRAIEAACIDDNSMFHSLDLTDSRAVLTLRVRVYRAEGYAERVYIELVFAVGNALLQDPQRLAVDIFHYAESQRRKLQAGEVWIAAGAKENE